MPKSIFRGVKRDVKVSCLLLLSGCTLIKFHDMALKTYLYRTDHERSRQSSTTAWRLAQSQRRRRCRCRTRQSISLSMRGISTQSVFVYLETKSRHTPCAQSKNSLSDSGNKIQNRLIGSVWLPFFSTITHFKHSLASKLFTSQLLNWLHFFCVCFSSSSI